MDGEGGKYIHDFIYQKKLVTWAMYSIPFLQRGSERSGNLPKVTQLRNTSEIQTQSSLTPESMPFPPPSVLQVCGREDMIGNRKEQITLG